MNRVLKAGELQGFRLTNRLGGAVVEINAALWQTTCMKTSQNYPTRIEDRKALKLMERIKTQVLQAKDSRKTAVPDSPKPSSAA